MVGFIDVFKIFLILNYIFQHWIKLIEMRLITMADAFRNQLNDPKSKEVPFKDRFEMLVDIENTATARITAKNDLSAMPDSISRKQV